MFILSREPGVYKITSSAYKCTLQVGVAELLYMQNNKGLRTDPCGTPTLTLTVPDLK